MGIMLHQFWLVNTDLDYSKVQILDFENKERQKFEDEELKALLYKDQSQTLTELTEAVNVIKIATFKYLKFMRMGQKQGNCVRYQLKARDVEKVFFHM